MRFATTTAVAVAAFLLFASGAEAEPGSAQLEVTLPGQLQGTASLASADGVLWFDDAAGAADLVLTADSLSVAIVEVWSYTPLSGTPLDAEGEVDLFSDHRVEEFRLTDASLVLRDRSDAFASLAWVEGAAGVATHTVPIAPANVSWDRDVDLSIHVLSEPLRFTGEAPRPETLHARALGQAIPFERTVDAGHLTLLTTASETTLAGAVGAYFADATVLLSGAQGPDVVELGSRYEMRPGSVYVPGKGWEGPGEHPERVDRYLQVEATNGLLRLASDGARSALHVPDAAIGLSGALRFAEASGTLTVSGNEAPVRGRDVVIGGMLTGHLAPTDASGGATYTASGDLTYVETAAAVQRYAPSSTLATAAAVSGIVGVAALAYFWQSVKFFVVGLLPLYARVEGKEVLTHEGRDLVYQLVRQSPGISASELSEAVSFGWSALVYHLKVLERNGLVISIRDGRYKRFFDKTSGLYANGRKLIVAVLRNATTAAIAQLVRREPGLTQKQICERMGIAASSVHWHAERLAEANLVVKERRGQNITYAPGEAWAKVEEMGIDAAPPASGAATDASDDAGADPAIAARSTTAV